jgi:hypothetical protein
MVAMATTSYGILEAEGISVDESSSCAELDLLDVRA